MRRRKWTLIFSIPFVAMLVAGGVYALYLFLAVGADDKLIRLFSGLALFVYFCVAGTMGRSVLDVLRSQGPALIVDAEGITDVEHDAELVPWTEIEKVKIDDEDNCIVVNFFEGSRYVAGRGQVSKITRRLLRRGDRKFPLQGLVFRWHDLEKALKEFHAAALAQEVDKA